MKKLITLTIFLFPFIVSAQNKTCTNSTLSIDLNTSQSVNHKKGTPYNPIQPIAFSTVHGQDKIQLVKKPTDIDVNFNGIYYECYEATDVDLVKVECCRTVVVTNSVPNAISPLEPFQISVYPNPVTGKQITVGFSGIVSSENIELTLLDMLGREVFTNSYAANQSSITLSTEEYSLKTGIYTLKVKQGDAFLNKIIIF